MIIVVISWYIEPRYVSKEGQQVLNSLRHGVDRPPRSSSVHDIARQDDDIGCGIDN